MHVVALTLIILLAGLAGWLLGYARGKVDCSAEVARTLRLHPLRTWVDTATGGTRARILTLDPSLRWRTEEIEL